MFSFRRSVGTGIFAVLPGKFLKSTESYLAPSRGAVWGYPEVGTIHGACGVCMRCMRRYGSVWLVVSDRSFLSWVSHCRTTSLQDDTPVCHDCLVVNGTSTFIINIPSRHGFKGVNVWSPAGN